MDCAKNWRKPASLGGLPMQIVKRRRQTANRPPDPTFNCRLSTPDVVYVESLIPSINYAFYTGGGQFFPETIAVFLERPLGGQPPFVVGVWLEQHGERRKEAGRIH